MRPNIRTIEMFVRAVESGSFVAAARHLLIDPAAVSRAIKSLEESLGILLFSRSTRALKLTAEGGRFYRIAGSAVNDVSNVTSDASPSDCKGLRHDVDWRLHEGFRRSGGAAWLMRRCTRST